jgi:uncharacterized membrane protein YidH (DUF202 family)
VSGDPPGDDQEVDGLARERTDLAWSRSGLAVFACLVAIAKRVLPDLSTLDARAIVVTALSVGALASAFSYLWARAVAVPAATGRQVADARKLRMVAFGTAALGVAATIIALLPDR